MNLIPAKRQRIVEATNVIFHVNQQICIIKNSTLLNKKFQRVQQLQKKNCTNFSGFTFANIREITIIWRTCTIYTRILPYTFIHGCWVYI